MFGGYNGTTPAQWYDDTWIFDYHNNTWTKRNPSIVGGTLTNRSLIQLVYDSNLGRSILFGGKLGTYQSGEDYDFNETWQYDFDEDTWYNVSYLEIGGNLYPREAYGIVYDSAHDKTILACGWYQWGHLVPEEGTSFLNDTWVFNANDISASISWTTDEPADSVVNYGTTTTLSNSESDSALLLKHEIVIYNLLPDMLYYFEIQSTDEDGNTAVDDNNGNYYTFTTNQDTIPPVITNVHTSGITHDLASIIWDTDELSNSKVNYGTTIYLGNTEIDTTMVTVHSITLTDLLPDTTYYFEVQSTDSEGNTGIDDNNGNYYSFTTDSEPSVDEMHVYSIDMWYEKVRNKFYIYTEIMIVDVYDHAVAGANVDIDLTLPNAVVESMSDMTDSNGKVKFIYGPTPKKGTFISTVTNVIKDGWTYNPNDNVETSETLYVS